MDPAVATRRNPPPPEARVRSAILKGRCRSPLTARVLAILTCSAPLVARADTYVVPTEVPSVAEALSLCSAGDVVWVSTGSYEETEDLSVKPGVMLLGPGRDLATVKTRIVWVEEAVGTALIETRISGIAFEQSEDYYWFFAARRNPTLVVEGCRFLSLGRVEVQSPGRIERNEFIFTDPLRFAPFDVASWWDGDDGELTIRENTFVLNDGGAHLSAYRHLRRVTVEHNTFAYPWWAHGAWLASFLASVDDGATMTLSNNIVFGMTERCAIGIPPSVLIQTYNCWYPLHTFPPAACQPGPESPVADPMFCDLGYPWSFDWHLQPGSPCIGAASDGTDIGALGVGCGLLDVGGTGGGENPPTLAVVSNPWRSSLELITQPSGGGSGAIEIFDVLGRCVWKEEVPAGRTSVVRWDGRDQHGGPAPPGVYIVRLKTEKGGVSQKTTRVSP